MSSSIAPAHAHDLYVNLTPELRSLAMRGTVYRYPKKTLLINEGEIGDHLFVLLKGSVKVFARDEAGREITYARIDAGDYFGEMSLDGGPRSASVFTLEPTTCAVLSRSNISEHLVVEPGFAIELVVQVIRRARAATEIARNMALLGVYTRLVNTLEEQAGLSPDDPEESTELFPLTVEPITHQDLAGRIGSSREMISRLLKDLEKGGYIKMSTRRIVMFRRLPVKW